MTPDTDWTRLARYFAGECSAEEAEEIRRWLAADPARQRLADELRAAWDAAAVPDTSWDTAASWQRLAARVRARERRAQVALVQPAWSGGAGRWARTGRWAAAAAAVVTVVAGGMLWRRAAEGANPAVVSAAPMREVRTAGGQRAVFRLVDGSRVILGPGSVLRYDPAQFGRSTRELHLDGRGYFEVTHDARRPFLVHTAHAVTEDLGTEFVVTDYANANAADAAAEVVVAGGTVAVRNAAGGGAGPATVLTRGELVRLDTAGRAAVQRGVDVAAHLAWTDGRLAFADTPVPDVLAQLSRWYDLDIRLGDPTLAAHRFTASYTNQRESTVLRELATAIGARVERRGRVVMLVPVRSRS